jgi:catechol 2,3-dioxygenase-like lactoylglutathione lyase family enzyme
MSDTIADPFGLGPIDQVGYVVHDLERALPRYESIFGPFEVATAPIEAATYRGKPSDCVLALAVNRSGPVEVELIAVVEGETPHTEHLRAHGEGPHHVRFKVEGLDQKLAALEAAGFETIYYKRFGPQVVFAYVETPDELGRSVIELLEMQ